jgi:ABC-type antimicrobial peptide transport system permease subunit
MTPFQVIAMFSTTAAFLGLISLLVGVPAGMALTKNLLNLMASSTGFGQISVSLDLLTVLWLIPFTLFISVLGSFLPARWAARMRIVKILRQE